MSHGGTEAGVAFDSSARARIGLMHHLLRRGGRGGLRLRARRSDIRVRVRERAAERSVRSVPFGAFRVRRERRTAHAVTTVLRVAEDRARRRRLVRVEQREQRRGVGVRAISRRRSAAAPAGAERRRVSASLRVRADERRGRALKHAERLRERVHQRGELGSGGWRGGENRGLRSTRAGPDGARAGVGGCGIRARGEYARAEGGVVAARLRTRARLVERLGGRRLGQRRARGEAQGRQGSVFTRCGGEGGENV